METSLMQNLQNDQKTKTTKNDQNGGRQIQENTLLKRDEVRQPAQNIKTRVIKSSDGMEDADSYSMR